MTDDRSESTPGESDEKSSSSSEKKTKKRKRRPAEGAARAVSAAKPGRTRPGHSSAKSRSPRSSGQVQALMVAVVALAMGIGIGWLAWGTAAASPTAAAVPSTSSSAGANGPCESWVTALCAEAGDKSEACETARSAATLLPVTACEAARSEVPATLAKIQTARSACDELVGKLCADLGQDSESCRMVKERTPSFPTTQCRQMLEDYDEVVGELRQMERQNAPLTPEAATAQAAGDGPSFGPASAKVTVVEYSDFECPFCSRAAAVVQKLKKNYADRVRFVFRQFPLPMHPNAGLASEAVLEAHQQGKFWELHDKLFENQRALDRQSIEGYAQQLGLNMPRFKKALDDGTHRSAIAADQALGEQIGVNGTPTMIVNAKRVPDPTNYAALTALIDAELAAAK